MKKILLFLFLPIIASTLLYCGSDSSKKSPSSSLAKINITNAESLFISSNGSKNVRATTGTDKIFKITDDGYVQEVSYEDKDGNTMTMDNEPSAIYNINSTYIIVCFQSEGYLVRKTDGAVFSLPNVPSEQVNYFINSNVCQVDNDGNIYYKCTGTTGIVYKINVTDPESITQEQYSSSVYNVENFHIDSNGNMLYGYLESSTLRKGIKKKNGGLYSLPTTVLLTWTAIDGNFYYYDSTIIKSVSIAANYSISTSDYGAALTIEESSGYSSYMLALQNRNIFITPMAVSSVSIYEVYNSTNSPRKITLSPTITISALKNAVSSDNYYYISGSNGDGNSILIKINPSDDTFTNLITPGDYDIYKMTVSAENDITFNALRMSDGKKVIGKIDSSGTLTTLDDSLDTEVTVLERIN